MSLQEDIARARELHRPVKALQAKLTEQVRGELEFENSTENAVAMHSHSIAGSLEQVMQIWMTSEEGRECVKREAAELWRVYTALALVLSAVGYEPPVLRVR